MKIRQGYVSNSSSSSFIAVGYILEDKSKKRYVDLINELDPSMSEKEFLKDFGHHFEENGISVICGNIDEGINEGESFIGIKPIQFYQLKPFSNDQFDISEIKEKLKPFEKYLLPEESHLKVVIGTEVY